MFEFYTFMLKCGFYFVEIASHKLLINYHKNVTF